MFEDIQAGSSGSESESSTSESESESEAVPVEDDCHQPQGVPSPIIDLSFMYRIFPEMNQGDSGERQVLIATNQTEFIIEAEPTRHGRTRKTRDMGEITACICGLPVASEERIATSMTAVVCGYRGCETAWVRVFHGT